MMRSFSPHRQGPIRESRYVQPDFVDAGDQDAQVVGVVIGWATPIAEAPLRW